MDHVNAAHGKLEEWLARRLKDNRITRGIVQALSTGKVRVFEVGAAVQSQELYAKIQGRKFQVDDEVLLIYVNGKPVILGPLQRETSSPPSVDATPVGTYPAAGTSPTVSNSGSDDAGQVNLLRGSGPSSGALWKLVFAHVMPNTNYVVDITPRSLAAQSLDWRVSSIASDGFVLSIGSGGSEGDQVNFSYSVHDSG